MSNADSTPIESSSDDVAVRAVNKRYEGLVSVRTKAVKGKGAWYWAHLEPVLVRNPETNAPNAVKLKCTLCDVAFSASNPSRTASEHLKRGACPNFTLMLKPVSDLPPLASPSSQKNHRKRTSQSQLQLQLQSQSQQSFPTSLDVYPISMKPLVLSGGQDDLGPLALLENSVKKLKSPKSAPSPSLSKPQVNKAFENLADWFYESCNTVSFSSLEHPKFRAFLNQVGLPPVSKRELLTTKLDSKFEEARMEAEARITDAAFFQVSSDGWKNANRASENHRLVKFTVNLPNGTTVFQRAVYCDGASVPPEYAEEVLWETARGICGSNARRCVGIVSDKYKAKALRNLEVRNQWMVNLSCQLHAFFSLIKDLCIHLPLFKSVSDSCIKIANLINSTPQIRNSLHKFRLQGLDLAGFIKVPPRKNSISKSLGPFIAMLDDLLSCSRILHLIVLDDLYKDDVTAREVADVIQDVRFWNDVEAVHSLVKMIMGMAEEIESERPLVGQCLPLWDELRTKVKNWCSKYNIAEGPVEKIVERRFKKNYHPAWSAAYILDPLYLIKDEISGKYLPPFKFLTHEQEKDVDKLVMRLVSREEAHVALMELMKWRSEGLDPLYAQAVQVKQRDPVTGKMKIANPQSSRLVWETCLKDFKSLSEVAVRLLFLHATSCGIKYDSRWFCGHGQSRLGLEIAQKLVFVAAHAKLVRREYSEEKDVQLFGTMDGEDDVLNEVLLDTASV